MSDSTSKPSSPAVHKTKRWNVVWVMPILALLIGAWLLYNNFAVVFGLVYVHLPFMVLPLYAALDRLDRSYIEASLDLGASQLRTFLSVVVPLALPGIVSGVIITFIPALGVSSDLASPRRILSATTDSAGMVSITAMAPLSMSGQTFWFQAAQSGQVSNVVVEEVD